MNIKGMWFNFNDFLEIRKSQDKFVITVFNF